MLRHAHRPLTPGLGGKPPRGGRGAVWQEGTSRLEQGEEAAFQAILASEEEEMNERQQEGLERTSPASVPSQPLVK